jgi:predicted MPP superfamily phosphohydrolase
MPLSFTRRSFLKALGVSLVTVGAVGLVGYGYVFHIEPIWYTVERIEIPIPDLPPEFHDFKIVCLSDIHFEPFADLDTMRRVVNQVNELEPDLVCLLGDYVFSSADSIFDLAPTLGELRARRGVFGILGNHDLWTNASIVLSGLENNGIKVLVNEHILIGSENAPLVLAGLDDGWSGEPNLDRALSEAPTNAPVILMLHEPDFADEITLDGRVYLQLSGHSHGGQVRLPFYGAPFLPAYAHKYDQGLYRVGEMWLYVTRGIGVISPPGRFNCRPEITEIVLIASEK